MASQKVYKNPQPGQPLLSVLSTKCKTPVLDVKFCSLVNPYYYPNSQTIPRRSITCVVDPELHKEFLKGIQTIEKNEKVDSVLKNDTVKEGKEHITTGKILIKFQSKDVIPVYSVVNEKDEPQLIQLEDELAKGEKVVVVFDILRYTKKNSVKVEHALSFKPSSIYIYAKES